MSLVLAAYLQENYPSIAPESITDPELLQIWNNRAEAWYKNKTATGFRHALVEFRKLQGHRHWSRETTLRHAMEALKKAGMI